MLPIRIDADIKAAVKGMNSLHAKHLPFASARTCTWLAQEGQTEVKRELPHQFILRNNWVRGGIRIDPATITSQQSQIGSITDFMGLQHSGGIKRPKKHKNLAIPVEAKKNKRSLITKANKPSNQLEKKNVFFGRTKHGKTAIFRRMPGHRLKMLYILTPTADIDPRFYLDKTVDRVVKTRFERLFTLSLDMAVK
jgi:hypothetical protein